MTSEPTKDPAAKETPKDQGNKRDRSPAFPYIGMTKALERIEVLFEKAKRHEVRVADIAKDWGMAAKSSSTDRNVAALIAYGLVEDSGGGDNRKIKISESGWRILDDKRPGIKEKFLHEAALKPAIISKFADIWSDGRPDDNHALSQLKFDGGFTDEGARIFLRVFDEAIRFTSKQDSAKKDATITEEQPPSARAKVGDIVQWVSNGVDQFDPPAKVVALSDDGQWIWVEGSQTGIPMNEVQVIQPANPPAGNSAPPAPPEVLAALAAAKQKPRVGFREDKFALKEGDVTISFPEGLSPDSVQDLDDYLKVFMRKAQREAGILVKPEPPKQS